MPLSPQGRMSQNTFLNSSVFSNVLKIFKEQIQHRDMAARQESKMEDIQNSAHSNPTWNDWSKEHTSLCLRPFYIFKIPFQTFLLSPDKADKEFGWKIIKQLERQLKSLYLYLVPLFNFSFFLCEKGANVLKKIIKSILVWGIVSTIFQCSEEL